MPRGRTTLESKFRDVFIAELRELFPRAIILKNDANFLQGVPDYIMLYGSFWAAFELKRSETAVRQPNQEWYVDTMDDWSFAAFVYPENKDKVLDALQRSLRDRG